jgi:TPR repeat protein
MKKQIMGAMVALAMGLAQADEMADGIKAWETQDFARAHQILGKLAAAGNPEAQLMVGEMYGFGEGVPEDMAKADEWLNKAKAGGHKDAAESLALMQQRRTHKAEIAYYVSSYKGDEVRLEKYNCVDPVFPEVSRTQVEIKEVEAKMDDWMTCYQRFQAGLQAVLPAGKAIPADVAKMMSLGELKQARENMDKAYAQVGADAQERGGKLIASHDVWAKRTIAVAKSMEEKTKKDAEIRSKYIEQLNERRRAMLSNPGMSH